jgi:O-antigen/teichoic acid export membrane protein
MSRALFPAFSMFVNDPERLRSSYRRAQTIIIGMALPVGIGTSALAKEIILVLVGSKWLLAVPVVRFLAPVIAVQTLATATEALAYAVGKTGILFRRTLTIFIFRATVLLIGFRLGGYMGIIYSRMLSGTFYLIYHMALAGRITSTPLWAPIISAWRSLVAAGVMWTVLLLLPKFEVIPTYYLMSVVILASQIALGATTYTVVHAVLWFLTGRPDGFERRMLSQAGRLPLPGPVVRQLRSMLS